MEESQGHIPPCVSRCREVCGLSSACLELETWRSLLWLPESKAQSMHIPEYQGRTILHLNGEKNNQLAYGAGWTGCGDFFVPFITVKTTKNP